MMVLLLVHEKEELTKAWTKRVTDSPPVLIGLLLCVIIALVRKRSVGLIVFMTEATPRNFFLGSVFMNCYKRKAVSNRKDGPLT